MNLNPDQLAAVQAREGFWQVLAGPGAGKTRVIVERYLALRTEGIQADDILCLTFTRNAAQEMATRAGIETNAPRGGFLTFHGFAYKLLMRERAALPFKLADEPVAPPSKIRRTIKNLIKPFPLLTVKQARRYISLTKRRAIEPQRALAEARDFTESQLASVYAEYERTLRAEGLLDFDSMALEAWRLLKQGEIAARWQFRFIQMDEAQDCDPLQWETAKILSHDHGNLLAVGDPAQCLYGWRAAAPDLFLDMGTSFPGTRTLYLARNYRSTPEIVDFCRRIAPFQGGLTERLSTENEPGPTPEFVSYRTDAIEAHALVATEVKEPERTAILARTNRALRPFEDACLERGIAYQLLGRSGFWARREIQDTLAFARVCVDLNDTDAIKRVVLAPYAPSKYLGRKFIEALARVWTNLFMALANPGEHWTAAQRQASRKLHNFLFKLADDVRNQGDPAFAMTLIIECADMKTYHMREGGDDEYTQDATPDNFAVDNLRELVRIAGGFPSLEVLIQHAHEAEQAAHAAGGLTIGTIHQAKGKEWDTVIVAGVSEGLLPHKLGDPEEEKRVFYVGCSRTAKRLVVSAHGEPSELWRAHAPKEEARCR